MEYKYKRLLHVADLRRGDIVRSLGGSGDSYVVTDSAGSLATAVRSIEISNAAEWEVLRTTDQQEHSNNSI